MKPPLSADITSILAIGAGAFVSGLLTAVMLSSTPDRNTHLTVQIEEEPYVQLDVEYGGSPVLLAGPEGPHSAWFPEDVEVHKVKVRTVQPKVHLESSSGSITFRRK